MPLPRPTADQRYATTLAHGLAVLRCYGPEDGALSNGELALRTSLSKATISRLTYTLALLGFLRFEPESRRYRLGATSLSVGYPVMAHLSVRQVARPFMQSLADRVRGAVSLGLRERASVVYIETTRASEATAFRPDIGATLPVMTTAMGRAWIAACTAAERDDALARVRLERAPGWRRLPSTLRKATAQLQAQGFCLGAGEFRSDVHAVAVPLAERVDGELVVVNCGVPAALLRSDSLQRQVGPWLVQVAAEIDAALRAAAEASA